MGKSSEEFIKQRERFQESIPLLTLYNVCYNRPMTIMQIVEYMGDNGYKTTRQSVEHGIQKIYETKDPDVQDFINHLTRKVK